MSSPFMNSVREYMREKHYSYKTEKSYISWITRYIQPLPVNGASDGGACPTCDCPDRYVAPDGVWRCPNCDTPRPIHPVIGGLV
jgi:hypothetical protein